MKTTPLLKGLTLLALALAAPAAFAQTTLYWAGGTTDITDGTAIPTAWSSLNGTWGGAQKNFATDTNGTTYTAWSDGSAFSGTSAGFTAGYTTEATTITLGANVSTPSLSWGFDIPGSSGNKYMNINASAAQSITLSGTAPVINVRGVGANPGAVDTVGVTINSSGANVSLIGTSGFSKTGNDLLRIYGTHDSLTGTVNVVHNANLYDGAAAGTLQIGASGTAGSLLGITRFNVTATAQSTAGNRARLFVHNQATSQNQIKNDAVINLGGVGLFQYQGRTGATETIGSLRLGSSGILDLSTAASGTGALVFTSGIDRANDRAQLAVAANNTSGLLTSTVNLGTSHGLGTGLLPWVADATRGRFYSVDGSNFLSMVAQTDVTDVSTITSSAVNYRITGNSTVITGAAATFASGAQANTLGFYRGSSTDPVTVTVTDTLTIASGGISVGNDNLNADVTITGGTSLTTAADAPLYISTPFSTTTGSLSIATPVAGNIDVVKTGMNDVRFTGTTANTYTGTTYINGGAITLNKSSGVAAIPGNVVIRSGGILAVSQNNQIADTSAVTVENGGYFNTGGSSETVASEVDPLNGARG